MFCHIVKKYKKEFACELFREARIRKNNYLSAPLRSCGAFLFYRKFRDLSYRIKKPVSMDQPVYHLMYVAPHHIDDSRKAVCFTPSSILRQIYHFGIISFHPVSTARRGIPQNTHK